ncbi:MAG: RNA methyltransferase substrate-binding domain-containing protein, partial [Candidatus Zixiibacteriota bacterium]
MGISKAELKKLAGLKAKKGRMEQNRLLVGGVRVLEEALKFGFLPVKLLYCPEQISERGQKLVDRFKLKKIDVSTVSSREIQAISDTETAQG